MLKLTTKSIWRLTSVTSSTLLATAVAGCSLHYYNPRVISKGEITIRAESHNVKFYGGKTLIAESQLAYQGLPDYVNCVPTARLHAVLARKNHIGGAILSAATAVLGFAGFVVLAYDADINHEAFSGRAFGVSVLSATALVGALSLRYRALGHAVDAMNYYNDAVGSLGGTCTERPLEPPQIVLHPRVIR